jgi:hypothetical protein
MFTCPVLILLYAWLTLTFQCEYSDFCSLLSIGHTALGIVFLSSSDQFYLDIYINSATLLYCQCGTSWAEIYI